MVIVLLLSSHSVHSDLHSISKTLSRVEAFALIEKLDHYFIFRRGGHVAKVREVGMLTVKMQLLLWLILGGPTMAREIRQPF